MQTRWVGLSTSRGYICSINTKRIWGQHEDMINGWYVVDKDEDVCCVDCLSPTDRQMILANSGQQKQRPLFCNTDLIEHLTSGLALALTFHISLKFSFDFYISLQDWVVCTYNILDGAFHVILVGIINLKSWSLTKCFVPSLPRQAPRKPYRWLLCFLFVIFMNEYVDIRQGQAYCYWYC